MEQLDALWQQIAAFAADIESVPLSEIDDRLDQFASQILANIESDQPGTVPSDSSSSEPTPESTTTGPDASASPSEASSPTTRPGRRPRSNRARHQRRHRPRNLRPHPSRRPPPLRDRTTSPAVRRSQRDDEWLRCPTNARTRSATERGSSATTQWPPSIVSTVRSSTYGSGASVAVASRE